MGSPSRKPYARGRKSDGHIREHWNHHKAMYRHKKFWKRIPKAGGKYAVFAPLEKATFDPDAVVFITMPLQGMRILSLDGYETGIADVAPYGGPFCSGVQASAISSGKISLGLLCAGSRQAGGFKPEELGLGVPYDRIPRIVRSIEGCHLGTAVPDNEAGTRLLGREDHLHRLADLDRYLKPKTEK